MRLVFIQICQFGWWQSGQSGWHVPHWSKFDSIRSLKINTIKNRVWPIQVKKPVRQIKLSSKSTLLQKHFPFLLSSYSDKKSPTAELIHFSATLVSTSDIWVSTPTTTSTSTLRRDVKVKHQLVKWVRKESAFLSFWWKRRERRESILWRHSPQNRIILGFSSRSRDSNHPPPSNLSVFL